MIDLQSFRLHKVFTFIVCNYIVQYINQMWTSKTKDQ